MKERREVRRDAFMEELLWRYARRVALAIRMSGVLKRRTMEVASELRETEP